MASEEAIMTEMQRLYETESLADELKDDASQMLLSWGEQQIDRLGTAEGDFEAQCVLLRKLLKAMNYYVGKRQTNSEEEQAGDRARMVELAQSIQLPAAEATQARIAAIDLSQDEPAVLQALIDTLTQPPASEADDMLTQPAHHEVPPGMPPQQAQPVANTEPSPEGEGGAETPENPQDTPPDTPTPEEEEPPQHRSLFSRLFGTAPDKDS